MTALLTNQTTMQRFKMTIKRRKSTTKRFKTLKKTKRKKTTTHQGLKCNTHHHITGFYPTVSPSDPLLSKVSEATPDSGMSFIISLALTHSLSRYLLDLCLDEAIILTKQSDVSTAHIVLSANMLACNWSKLQKVRTPKTEWWILFLAFGFSYCPDLIFAT